MPIGSLTEEKINLIIGDGNPLMVSELLQIYLNSIIQSFEAECHRASSEGQVNFSRMYEHLNLTSAEVYWEWLINDPTGFVHAVSESSRSFAARNFSQGEYDFAGSPSGVSEETTVNSRRLLIEHLAGQSIRVYSKTNRRVRFEIVNQLRGQGRLQNFGNHTRDNWNIRPFAEQALELSRSALNLLLSHLAQDQRFSGSQESALSLINHIVSASDSLEVSQAILSILVHERSIASTSELRAALKRLSRRNVLVNRNRRYHVGPQFRAALSVLTENAQGFPVLLE